MPGTMVQLGNQEELHKHRAKPVKSLATPPVSFFHKKENHQSSCSKGLWTVTCTETKDGSSHCYMQWYTPGCKQTCLFH